MSKLADRPRSSSLGQITMIKLVLLFICMTRLTALRYTLILWIILEFISPIGGAVRSRDSSLIDNVSHIIQANKVHLLLIFKRA